MSEKPLLRSDRFRPKPVVAVKRRYRRSGLLGGFGDYFLGCGRIQRIAVARTSANSSAASAPNDSSLIQRSMADRSCGVNEWLRRGGLIGFGFQDANFGRLAIVFKN